MGISRRKFIGIIGGGSVAAAVGGVGGFLATRTPQDALAPWAQAGTYSDPRKRALSYAILAPNPHNRQPWIVDLSTSGEIGVFVDRDRMLPHTDPFNRQITIGLGCFLEVLRMAAAQNGYRAVTTPFPQGYGASGLDGRMVARVVFEKDADIVPDTLFEHVLARRSLKVPYDMAREVPEAVIDGLLALQQDDVRIGATNETSKVSDLRALTRAGLRIETETPRTYQESVDLFRIGKAEINANPDGISFGGPLFDSLAAVGAFSREMAADTTSPIYSQGIDTVMKNADSGMGYVWLATSGNSRIDQLNAGRDWVRINLATTGMGIGLHPMSQALQEFDEMGAVFAKAHKMMAPNGEVVQMLGRMGYADRTAPTPRWPIDAKIRT